MHLTFDSINILVALAGVANLIYGFIVWERGKTQPANRTFFFFATTVALWSVGMVLFRSAQSEADALVAVRVLYVIAALVPIAFVYFSLAFESTKRISGRLKALLALPGAFIIYSAVVPNALISAVRFREGEEPFIVFNQSFHEVYLAYISVYALAVFVLLLMRFLHSTGATRNRIAYILIGTSLPWTVGITTNLILPLVGNFDYNWMGQISTFFSTTIISYGIFRSRLFDVRIVATELLVFMLWVILFVQIIVSESFSTIVFDTIILILLVIAGILLIKSVYREIEQREKIEELSNQKSEFMTFASHEIRNPITAMRGYASLIVDGTVDHASPEVKAVAQKILIGGNDVLNLIAQFLSKSKMELGQISYNSAPFDLGAAASSIVDGYVPHAELRGLTLEKKIDASHPYIIKADEGKVKEVIGNLIDNSLKYTVHGGVTVAVERHGVAVRLTISDTGVGIAPETLPHLFKKFSRADAQKVNLLGTGVGLYLAKTFIEAMGGRIWAESEGKDKGSRFILEFPPAT